MLAIDVLLCFYLHFCASCWLSICAHKYVSRLLKHINVLNLVTFFFLMAQCMILRVGLFICIVYALSLTSTFVLSCSTVFAGEEEVLFGYFTPTEGDEHV